MENTNSRRNLLIVLLALVVGLSGFGLGAAAMYVSGISRTQAAQNGSPTESADGGSTTSQAAPPEMSAQFKSLWDAYQIVQNESYYRPADRQKMINGATKGMLESLGDDYTFFLSPQETKAERQRFAGDFEGVGIYIGERNHLPTVIAPIPNTPADRAGLRARDIIIAVDGRDVTKMSVDEIAGIVRGPASTKVRLTIVRGGKAPFDVELTRARIDAPEVSVKMLDNNIAHISVDIFGDKTTQQLDDAIKQVQEKKSPGVILDLRNNGGGYVVAAEQMLGRFLPEGSTAFYQSAKGDHSDDRPQKVIADGPKMLDIPMVVLINGGSASASEITAGALQDYGRAKLIGEQSFGKGSEQNVHSFSDGSSAHITIAHWLTPKKRDINPRPTPTTNGTPPPLPTFTPTPRATVPPAAATATFEAQPALPVLTDRGLMPDIVVVRTEKDYQDDKDPQLDRALEYMKTGK